MDRYCSPSKIDELRRKVESCFDESLAQEWQMVKNHQSEDLIIYSKTSTEGSGKMFKGEGVIAASPEECFRHCHPRPESSRAQWDSSIKSMQVVEMLQDNQWPEIYILRTMTGSAAMGMISARDFVDLIININDDKMVGTLAENVSSEKCPPQQGYVRGVNRYCGIICLRIAGEPSKTRLVFLAHAEIGGRIPSAIVEAAVPSAIRSFFSDLKKELKKQRQ